MWPKIILLCKRIIFNLKYCNSWKNGVILVFWCKYIRIFFLEGHYFLDIQYFAPAIQYNLRFADPYFFLIRTWIRDVFKYRLGGRGGVNLACGVWRVQKQLWWNKNVRIWKEPNSFVNSLSLLRNFFSSPPSQHWLTYTTLIQIV